MGKHTFEVNDGNFQQDVLSADQPVLIDFWADWCQPCKALAPVIEEMAVKYEGKLRIGKLDIDSNNMHMNYDVQGIPTMILFKGGKEVHRIVGYRTKDKLDAELAKHLDSN
jgi:thioredoxin 1